MAFTLSLGPEGGSVLDFSDASKYGILGGALAFNPSRKRVLFEVTGRDAVRLAYSQETQLTISAPFFFTGANQNAALTNWENVDVQLQAARDWQFNQRNSQGDVNIILKYQWENETNAVVFDVLDGDFKKITADYGRFSNYLLGAQLEIICFPIGRAASATTLTSGSLSTDTATYSPGAVSGNRRAPARLRMQNTTAAQTMDFFRCATRTKGTIANFLWEFLTGKHTAPTGYGVVLNGAGTICQIDVAIDLQDAGVAANVALVWFPGSGSTYYQIGQQMITAADSAWHTFTRTAYINPATQLAWGGNGNSAPWTTPAPDLNAADACFGIKNLASTTVNASNMVLTVTYLDRDLVTHTTTLTLNDDGGTTQWTKHGGATNWQCLNDATHTNYLSDATSGHISIVEFAAYTVAADGGIRAHFSPLLINGGLNTGVNPYAGNAPDGWTATGAGSAATAQTSGPAPVEGDSWCNVDNGSGTGGTGRSINQTYPVVAGATYRLRVNMTPVTAASIATCYAATDGAVPATLTLATPTGASLSTFQFYQGTLVAPSDATQITVYLWSNVGGARHVGFDAVILTREDNTSNEWVRITETANLTDQYGSHRVFARMKPNAAFHVNSHYGGATGNLLSKGDVPIALSTTVTIQDLNGIDIPAQHIPSGVAPATGGHAFGIWSGQQYMNTAYVDSWVDIDTIELFPVDENYIEFEAVTAGTGPAQNQYVVSDGQAWPPVCYEADSSGNYLQPFEFAGNTLWLPPTSAMLVLARGSRARGNDVRGDTIGLDIQYYARYAWLY